jgi:hypothetical protein
MRESGIKGGQVKLISIFIFLSLTAFAAQFGWKSGSITVNGPIDSPSIVRMEKVGSTVIIRSPAVLGTNANGLNLNVTLGGGTGTGTTGILRLRSAISGVSGTTPHTLADIITISNGGLGFFGAANTGRGAAIPDPAGGVEIDAECRNAVRSILDELRTRGLITP